VTGPGANPAPGEVYGGELQERRMGFEEVQRRAEEGISGGFVPLPVQSPPPARPRRGSDSWTVQALAQRRWITVGLAAALAVGLARWAEARLAEREARSPGRAPEVVHKRVCQNSIRSQRADRLARHLAFRFREVQVWMLRSGRSRLPLPSFPPLQRSRPLPSILRWPSAVGPFGVNPFVELHRRRSLRRLLVEGGWWGWGSFGLDRSGHPRLVLTLPTQLPPVLERLRALAGPGSLRPVGGGRGGHR
jgi:hypothetical protein